MTVKEITNYLNEHIPFDTAEDFDNVGHLIGDENQSVSRVLIALDATQNVIEQAIKFQAPLIVTHHPVIFTPLKSLMQSDLTTCILKNNLNVISLHTNLDKLPGGVNDMLAKALELQSIRSFPGSDDMGRIGDLPLAMASHSFAKKVKDNLNCNGLRFVPSDREIRTVAVLGGSGEFALQSAIDAGADAFVTGEGKHHVFLEAVQKGLCYVDAGHFETERVVLPFLKQRLHEAFHRLELIVADEASPVCFL